MHPSGKERQLLYGRKLKEVAYQHHTMPAEVEIPALKDLAYPKVNEVEKVAADYRLLINNKVLDVL